MLRTQIIDSFTTDIKLGLTIQRFLPAALQEEHPFYRQLVMFQDWMVAEIILLRTSGLDVKLESMLLHLSCHKYRLYFIGWVYEQEATLRLCISQSAILVGGGSGLYFHRQLLLA